VKREEEETVAKAANEQRVKEEADTTISEKEGITIAKSTC
jgi:hypothetical protein